MKYYRNVCFLSQQVVEKLLKAYLLHRTNRYPFIHDTTELINICKKLEADFELLFKIKADMLDKYYTGTRYPPLVKVSEEEAEKAIEIAEEVRRFVLERIK